MSNPEDLKRELAELSRRWLERLDGRIEAIEQAAGPVLAGSADLQGVEELRFLLHRLGGAGSSFGHPEVSRLALAGEHVLRPVLAEKRVPRPDELVALGSAIGDLRRACTNAVDGRSRLE